MKIMKTAFLMIVLSLAAMMVMAGCKIELPKARPCTDGYYKCSADNIQVQQCSGGAWNTITTCSGDTPICNVKYPTYPSQSETNMGCTQGCLYEGNGYYPGSVCVNYKRSAICNPTVDNNEVQFTDCTLTTPWCYQGVCTNCNPICYGCGGLPNACGGDCPAKNDGDSCYTVGGIGQCDSGLNCVKTDPLLYYNFNEIGAIDKSGNGMTGTVTGATYTATGGHGGSGAYVFSGNDNYIIMNYTGLQNLLQNDASISVWFKYEMPLEAFPTLIGNSQFIANAWKGWRLVISPGSSGYGTGNIMFAYAKDAISQATYKAGTAIQADSGQWNHVVVTRSAGGYVKLYLNGNLETESSNAPNFVPNTGYPVYIGKTAAQTNNDFKGIVDDVRIYDHVLTSEQINNLYQTGDI